MEHEVPVPDSPEEAQQLLYLLLGRAIARCQVAEASADTIHHVLLGKPARERSTLGAKAKAVEPELPEHLQAEYRELVEARNYLVHRLLFDHGGWKGIPGWDSPALYRKLYDSIGEALQTIERVSDLLSRYLVDTNPEVAIFRISDEGVQDIRDL
ncbi:hypothetical protein J4H92_09825 [Leucobacter weissii]|uniref:Uncharacterized protein n=1 Tax=Leucobacter weissii TaxID=1983706 RepID=A0A939MK55_9MICO|nr:hypothetical protein [Leucobacter weissii]MBO1902243.1 hypothetical protein [Leucobacter weissii]